MTFYPVAFLVGLVLAFEFVNAYLNAPDSIASIASTGVLKPHQAVAWVALFGGAGFFVFGLPVATLMATGLVDATRVDPAALACALLTAIAWHLVAARRRVPTSAAHALVGGLIGAMAAKAGAQGLVAEGVVKIVLVAVAAPMIAFVVGALLMVAMSWAFVRATPRLADSWLRRAQLVSSALLSLGHGSNNAQKTVGVAWLALIAGGWSLPEGAPPAWVVAASYAAVAAGTLVGGRRIIRTMGQKFARLRPVGGFCAEAGAAATLLSTLAAGTPVSPKHTITGAIAGAASAHRVSAFRWDLAAELLWPAILTIPATATLAAIAWWIAQHLL
ncbi:MAG TPA: inorganic phosphate transporter [Burkholderiaceae bacterium]